MAIVTYPINLPEPTGLEYNLVQPPELVVMQSGRRRIRRTIPHPISEGVLQWTLLPEEYSLFMGWWRYTLGMGTHYIQFDDSTSMVTNTGIKVIMLKPNTLSSPLSLGLKTQVSSGFWGLQEA